MRVRTDTPSRLFMKGVSFLLFIYLFMVNLLCLRSFKQETVLLLLFFSAFLSEIQKWRIVNFKNTISGTCLDIASETIDTFSLSL